MGISQEEHEAYVDRADEDKTRRKEQPNYGGKHYLGDGLYAQFDGFMVTLSAPREFGEHYVCLEPEVLRRFNKWIAEMGERTGRALV
jgi:hypothetical protein